MINSLLSSGFFCTVWSTLIRISLTKALVLWWCDNKSDLIWFEISDHRSLSWLTGTSLENATPPSSRARGVRVSCAADQSRGAARGINRNNGEVTGRMALMSGIIYALTSLLLGICAGLSAPRNHPANEGKRGLNKEEKFRALSETRANNVTRKTVTVTICGQFQKNPDERRLFIILTTLSLRLFLDYKFWVSG